jgi:hypothetical protein
VLCTVLKFPTCPKISGIALMGPVKPVVLRFAVIYLPQQTGVVTVKRLLYTFNHNVQPFATNHCCNL